MTNVRVDVIPPVATIWLDRPDKRNALDLAMWVDLRAAVASVADDPAVRVVVLRGHGEHFSAGADVRELRALNADAWAAGPSLAAATAAAESALVAVGKPTIALVLGDCIGGGCALAIDCDLRIVASSARFGITPANLGVVYPPAGIERAVRLVGPSAASFLLLSGELIDANRALRIGLVDEVHSPNGAEARVSELAATMASRSLLSQAAAKEMIADVSASGAVAAATAERWANVGGGDAELAEGVAAFTLRRPPSFPWAPAQDGEARRAAGSTP
jgi:enoyl-CoA hydratase/carnithine racemase